MAKVYQEKADTLIGRIAEAQTREDLDSLVELAYSDENLHDVPGFAEKLPGVIGDAEARLKGNVNKEAPNEQKAQAEQQERPEQPAPQVEPAPPEKQPTPEAEKAVTPKIVLKTSEGEWKTDERLPEKPIRLEQGDDLYGLNHILKDKTKLKRIKEAGFESPENFVEYVSQHYEQIWKQSNGRYMLVKPEGNSLLEVVELRPDEGGYYSVVTAYTAPAAYPAKQGRQLLWEGRKPPIQTGNSESLLQVNPAKPTGQETPGARGQSSYSKDSTLKNEIKPPKRSKAEAEQYLNEKMDEPVVKPKGKPTTTEKAKKPAKGAHLTARGPQKPGRYKTLDEVSQDPVYQEAYANLDKRLKGHIKTLDDAAKQGVKVLGSFYNPEGGVRRSSFENELYTPIGFRAAVKDGQPRIYLDGYNENGDFSSRIMANHDGDLKLTKYAGFEGPYHNIHHTAKHFDPANAVYEQAMNPILKKQALNNKIEAIDYQNGATKVKASFKDLDTQYGRKEAKKIVEQAVNRMPEPVRKQLTKEMGGC